MENSHIYIINGRPRSGKDEFVKQVSAIVSDSCCLNISTVDFVKEVAKFCGWNGEKDLAARRFLSDLKDALTRWNDVPHKKVKEEITKFIGIHLNKHKQKLENLYIFIHSREPEDIDKLKLELNAKTLLITRAEVENQDLSNHADSNVYNYNYDFVIHNDGTIDDLHQQAQDFVNNEQ